MKKIFCFVLLSIGVLSCKKSDVSVNANAQYNTYVNSIIDFKVEDDNRVNLLSKLNAGNYQYEDIDVITINNGKQVVYYNDKAMPNAAKGFVFMGQDTDPYIRLFLNCPINGETETFTYLKFKGCPIDTLKALYQINEGTSINYGGSSVLVLKIWLNGKLLFDKNNQTAGILPIIEKPSKQ